MFYHRFYALPVGHWGLHWSWPMLHHSTSRGAQSTIIPDSPQRHGNIWGDWSFLVVVFDGNYRDAGQTGKTWWFNCGQSVTNWRQNLHEQLSHLLPDLQAFCLQTVSISYGELISLIYEVQHFYILQVAALYLTSVFPILLDTEYDLDVPYLWVFNILFTKHPQYQLLEFTGQHYTVVAEYAMMFFL